MKPARQSLLLAACLWLLAGHASAAPPARCTVAQTDASPEDVASAIALQNKIQAHPLYKMLASRARHATCRVTFQETGKLAIFRKCMLRRHAIGARAADNTDCAYQGIICKQVRH